MFKEGDYVNVAQPGAQPNRRKYLMQTEDGMFVCQSINSPAVHFYRHCNPLPTTPYIINGEDYALDEIQVRSLNNLLGIRPNPTTATPNG